MRAAPDTAKTTAFRCVQYRVNNEHRDTQQQQNSIFYLPQFNFFMLKVKITFRFLKRMAFLVTPQS